MVPAVLYACKTWLKTKRDKEKFVVAERAMERRISDTTRTDRLSSEKLPHRTSVKDVVSEIYAAKRMWAGHFALKSNIRWTCRLADWMPRERKRQRGRPRTRWDKPLVRLYFQRWKQKTQNRSKRKLAGLHRSLADG